MLPPRSDEGASAPIAVASLFLLTIVLSASAYVWAAREPIAPPLRTIALVGDGPLETWGAGQSKTFAVSVASPDATYGGFALLLDGDALACADGWRLLRASSVVPCETARSQLVRAGDVIDVWDSARPIAGRQLALVDIAHGRTVFTTHVT